MRKLLCLLLVLSPLSFSIAKSKNIIILNSTKGLISLKGEVNNEMKDSFIEKIMLDPSKTFKVYIDSPGGDVIVMNEIIEHMENSGKKFHCYAKFAASAAFMIFQMCDKRYMLPYSGILMSHNSQVRLSGDIEKVKKLMLTFDIILQKIERKIAERLGLPYEIYKSHIANELWLNYEQALTMKAVDGEAYLSCTSSLAEQKEVNNKLICSLFGCQVAKKTVSACPLIDKEY